MKFCKDCKYFYVPEGLDICSGTCKHPNNTTLNYVTGDYIYYKFSTFADICRQEPKACGVSAKWFEQKEIVEEKRSFWRKLFFKRGY